MGSSNDIREENKKLKQEIEKIENEYKPEIERLKIGNLVQIENERKLKKEMNNLKKEIEKNKKDLSPEEIQKLMEENANLYDEIKTLKIQCNNYKKYCENLTLEYNQLKLSCGQYQLMLLMKMQPMTNNQNFNNFNNFQNQFSIYKKQMNNMLNNNFYDNNFKNKYFNQNIQNNSNNIISIIFNIDNKIKYPFITLPEYKLRDIFSIISMQIEDKEYSNIGNLQFFYMAKNVTAHFINNDEVRSLNFSSFSPVVDVLKSNHQF